MARAADPEAIDTLIERVWDALEADDPDGGLSAADEALRLARRCGDPDLLRDARLAAAAASNQVGESREALRFAEEALADDPDDVDAMLERGLALWELLRLDEARAQLEDVARRAPDEARAHHTLGLLAERRGQAREAKRRLERARRLAPGDFPAPVRLTRGEFDSAVEGALASLPAQVRRYLENVAIAVEDLPADDDLLASDPPLSPTILGIFRGAPLPQKGSDPWSHFPSSIVLYQRNLERFTRSRSELIEQIGVTLVHEVGHFLGLDEDDLRERGLE